MSDSPIDGPSGIDVPSVSAWLPENIRAAVAPFTFEAIEGGRSNVTVGVIDANGTRYVLRRPPLGMVLATAHDMAREHRIVSAVGRTAVPVPEALGLCTDVTVTGAPFYVMSWMDGLVLADPDTAQRLSMQARSDASNHLIDVLADLHSADVDGIGLGDLARRDGFIERQVRRWTAQWQSSKTRELTAIDHAAELLAKHVPAQQTSAIVHGDYRFGNCLVEPASGRITAVLDWELCTLGDPLADLGYLGVVWFDAALDTPVTTDPTSAGGFPRYADLIERYALRTGRDLSSIQYYVAFSCWRLAIICEGVYSRYLGGAMGHHDVDLDAFRTNTETLSTRAVETLVRRT